jgi:hypothetical protein
MKKIHIAILAMGFVTGSVNAADFSFTGNFEHDSEVQEFNFTVSAPTSDVTLRTWSYAGGTNAAGAEVARGGFDPIVTLFDASGNLLGENDDSDLVTDSVSGNAWDSLLTRDLSAGNYTATVTQYDSFANGPLLADGFQGTADMNFSGRDPHWALDISNVSSASVGASYVSEVPSIPEPESYALLLAGLGLITFMIRYSSRKQMPV